MSRPLKQRKSKPSGDKITVTVSIPDDLVAAADCVARAEERSRSFVFERALKRDLAQQEVAA